VPVVGAGIRAVGRPLLGLNRLHAASLGDVAPALAPPRPSDDAG
jgi:energy-converting hydrogenase Eha subunit A